MATKDKLVSLEVLKETTQADVGELKSAVDSHYGQTFISFTLEGGTINASGQEQARNDRIRTADYIDLSEYAGSVTIPENHAIMPAYYNSSKVWQSNGSWVTSASVSDFSNYPYVRFVLSNNKNVSGDISGEIGTIVFAMTKKNKSNAELVTDGRQAKENIELLQSPVELGGLCQVGRLGWYVYANNTPPEQSIPSYALAYKNGCRIMLADIQVTEDGEYVCFHDLTLGDDPSTSNPVRHTDGSELTSAEKAYTIGELTLAELDEFDFGIKKGQQYAGTKILRFADFLKWCKVMNCTAMAETKVTMTAAQAGEIANMVNMYGMDKNFIWAENAYESSWGGITIPVIVAQLPNAIIHVRGGSNNYANAVLFAKRYATAEKHTELSFTNAEDLTSEVIADLNENYVDVAFSEIKNLSTLDTMVSNGLIYKIKSVACSYVNIGRYFRDKYLQ